VHGRPKPPKSTRPRRITQAPARDRSSLIIGGLTALACAAILAAGPLGIGGRSFEEPQAVAVVTPTSTVQAAAQPLAGQPEAAADVAEEAAETPRSVDLGGCQVSDSWLTAGATGESVICVQKALYAAGTYDGEFSGDFDFETDQAVRLFQEQNGLYVDGIVGGRTAEAMGIWPGEESFVVRTPPPPAGAEDLLGYPLSSVATAGDDAPEMPPNTGQGTGKRIVYSRAGQRVWAVDDDERVVRSYLVTGSQYANELPGTHAIYSRSEVSTAWNGEADLPYMVRWLDTERGAIGFHEIPLHRGTGEPYQTEAELGTKDSGGCQRQAPEDAWFMWNFGTIGTPVIVV
jgi:peptidoglycan hydrolase-like protein with peptidoglycan-binding domain